ncbi:MAG: DoxX family membrane protein [Desulfobacteraceae bacterium]|nr:DoxX family membrane protein [Desulfobacteraceae bacterium]
MKFLFSSKKMYMVIRILLGLVFVGSGIIKMSDLTYFSKVIAAFAILPLDLSYPFSVIISMAELIFGVGLIIDVKGSLGAISLMLLAFLVVLSWAIYMGYDIDCGCFGPEDPEAKVFSSLKGSLLRDVLFIIQAIYLYSWRSKNDYLPSSINVF